MLIFTSYLAVFYKSHIINKNQRSFQQLNNKLITYFEFDIKFRAQLANPFFI